MQVSLDAPQGFVLDKTTVCTLSLPAQREAGADTAKPIHCQVCLCVLWEVIWICARPGSNTGRGFLLQVSPLVLKAVLTPVSP